MAVLIASKDKVNFSVPVNFINQNTINPGTTPPPVKKEGNGAGKNVQK